MVGRPVQDLPPQWYHYHSVFELAVAVNLAIIALPELRAPALSVEAERWTQLSRLITPDHQMHDNVYAALWEFVRVRRGFEEKFAGVIFFVWLVVMVCAGFLVYATVFADRRPCPLLPWLAIAVAACPAIIFYGLNWQAKGEIAQSSAHRRRLEAEVVAG
jgi:hypothetical protein